LIEEIQMFFRNKLITGSTKADQTAITRSESEMKKVPILLAATCLLAGNASFAQTSLDDLQITFNGFGSAVSGFTTDHDETYRGYTSDNTFELETLAALQANVDLKDDLSFVVQMVARGDQDYEVETEWAYLGYRFNDRFKANVGRIRLPLYMYSDYLDVGYAYPWIRPPAQFYASPTSALDAATLYWNEYIGDFASQVQVTSDGDESNGVSWTVTYNDSLSVRAAVFTAELSVPGPTAGFAEGLETALAGSAVPFSYDDAVTDEDKVDFVTFGAKFDNGDWFAASEWGKINFDPGFLADVNNWYVSLGKRFGKFQAYGVYGASDYDADLRSLSGIPTNPAGLPNVGAMIPLGFNPANTGALYGSYIPLDATLELQNSKSSDITLGVRWDFHKSAALKLEVTEHDDDLRSAGDASLTAAEAAGVSLSALPSAGDATLVNIGIDVVF
jgi:hypothetical protein